SRYSRLGAYLIQSNAPRNSLYFAFRELGRVVRTQFLLEYISDIDLRESITASTCKSEEFNEFLPSEVRLFLLELKPLG
ncbi:uncharacterized protein METZ01_LOCUS232238, partial [marine metagenome]